ncbi:hydroxyethylthiazole kinase [Staphylococcus muscae]|uniref:Hydroxyethylthiazole kinase n=1 Tax=Staphylococcus muscae TaxID=1294 RepID=A0A240C815_9STAP|nr:hydroxyethylthiazole kinase [Staphylococcus muscae]AVQ33508.1 hydroxyethylthiazole kinase [Staphylococcus muscae]PNZ05510.1 hydroxyethylthiazole kinase [Staphylococcus muscae]GGA91917.1 hydroxyethylthiazole kinase [Staphylococcus muscae]SNW03423.1 hydroxyethylthiazole kinase [Staphylococcus muscae]
MSDYLSAVRKESPLVICYTNDVVKNFTANGLLSLGASPAMSEAPEEAVDFFKVAQALLINIGTLTQQSGEDMLSIAKEANRQGVPIVFDPVAVGASQFRRNFCRRFLEEVQVTVIKGNASEILALVDESTTMKGTDSTLDQLPIEAAKQAQLKYNAAIVMTGETDVIIQDGRAIALGNGTPLLAKVTGTGCLLGAVVASFLLKDTHPSLEKLAEAVSYYTISAERAEVKAGADLPGTFAVAFLDALSQTATVAFQQEIKKREVKNDDI